MFAEVLKEAASKATDSIRASEQKLADEFRKLGKTVVEPDREVAAARLEHDLVGLGLVERLDLLGLARALGLR